MLHTSWRLACGAPEPPPCRDQHYDPFPSFPCPSWHAVTVSSVPHVGVVVGLEVGQRRGQAAEHGHRHVQRHRRDATVLVSS